MQVNQDVIEAFIGNKEEFKYDSERILQLIESINGSTRDDAEDIADKFLQLIPQDIGGKAESLDIWGRETLILLILSLHNDIINKRWNLNELKKRGKR